MRTSILVSRKHGQEAFELMAGPEVPIAEQDKEFREAMICGGVHPEIAELHRAFSDGEEGRVLKFRKPEDVKAAREKIAADLEARAEEQNNPGAKAKKQAAAEKAAGGETTSDAESPAQDL